MTRPVVFRPQADAEVLAARRWYDSRREGLGREFGSAVDELVGRITNNPLAFPIDEVPAGDIVSTLEHQLPETLALLNGISEDRSLHRYGPDKWTIREVPSHINDCERLFTFRALWFARGFDSPLPSFDQNIAISTANADQRSWSSHVEEFGAIRGATVELFRSLGADAWMRRGVAIGYEFTVRALAYITAGHVTNHTSILRERYL